jgi:hypothetical protein
MTVGLTLGFGGAIAVISAIDVLSVRDTERQESVVVRIDDARQYCERRGLQLDRGSATASTWSCADPAAPTARLVSIAVADLCRERFGTAPAATVDGVLRCVAAP